MRRLIPHGWRWFGAALLCGTMLLSTAPAQNPPPGNNPWERDLMTRSGSDGSSFGPESLFCRASGVPSLIREERSGRLIAAFQWFPQGDTVNWDRVAVKTSWDNGRTWSDPQPIQVQALPGTYSRPFDPTLAALDDGRIRIYFSSNTNGQTTLDAGVATYSAISSDGVHYTFEPGMRFGVEGKVVIDPAVLKLGETWHYTAPIGRPEDGAYHATSADGLNFTRVEDIPSVGGVNWTGNLVAYGDGMRFYGSSGRGIWWAFTRDGSTWTPPAYLPVQGGDPSVVPAGDGSYLMVYVGNPSQVGPTIQVEHVRSTYRTTRGGTAGFFRSGQSADIMLSGVDFNNTGGALLFNHPGGIGGDGNRIFLADRNNNRILVWLSPPPGNTSPDLVLGQPDFAQNSPGTGLNQLNWPCAVAASANGRIVVADTNNDRLLIWSRFPAGNGAAADLEIRLPGISSGGQPFGWPWGVWTDGERLAATATHGGAILFWRTFPVVSNQAPDFILTDPAFGTLRAITSDGSFLIVDDHNAKVPGSPTEFSSGQGTFFWRHFPSDSSARYDFAISGVRLRGGKVDNKLVLLGGGSMRIWDGFPAGPADPPALTVAGSWNSDGVGLAVAGGTLYTLDENQNKIIAFRSTPAQGNAVADFAVGSPDTATNTLRTHYFVTNPVPVSNGTNLFVSSDFDRKLYVWRRLPDESGAYPDLVYSLPEAPWANALLGNILVLAGKRTVYIWDRLPLYGEPPAVTLSNTIGYINLGEIRGVALDARYFYLSDYQQGKVYVWKGIPAAGSSPVAVLDAGGQPVRLSSDGNHLAVTILGPLPSVKLYPVAGLESGAGPAAVVTRPGFNLPEGALVAGGSLFVADTVFSRVLAWSHISDAIGGQDPDVILGARDLNDRSAEIGRDKLFWPGALSFDGTYLWAGEFKFSSRLLRFSPGDPLSKNHLVLPKLVAGPDRESGIAVANPAADPAQASFTAHANDGSLLSAKDLINPVTRALPGQSQLALTARQLFGDGLNTDGSWVRIAGDSSDLAGIFLSFNPEVSILDGTDLAGRFLQSMIFPEARDAEISLANPGHAQAAATARWVSDEGNILATAPLVIPPSGRVAFLADGLFAPGPPSHGGYLEVQSNSSLAALEEFGLPGIWRATLNPLDAYGGSKRLYAPQWATGGGWHSSVTLINLENLPTTVSIVLFADDGSIAGQVAPFPLPAKGRIVLTELPEMIAGREGTLLQGYLRIDSSVSRLSGFVRFGDPAEAAFQAALPLVDRGVMELLFPHIAANDFYFTGLAVLNLESDSAELTITVIDPGGESLASGTFHLAPGARLARLISQMFPDLPPLARGYIRIRSSRPVAAYAVFGTNALTAISAIPAR